MHPNDPHFNKIFWFIVGLTLYGALYTVAVTFLPIPKGSERFADTGHVFWLSTAVSGGIGYLLGSSASNLRRNNKTETPETTISAQFTATTAATTTEKKKEEEEESGGNQQ